MTKCYCCPFGLVHMSHCSPTYAPPVDQRILSSVSTIAAVMCIVLRSQLHGA